MENHPQPPDDDDAPEIADAASLFDDSAAKRPGAEPARTGESSDPGVFEVEETDESSRAGPAVPVFADEGREPSKRARPATTKPRLEPSEAVPEVWSRGAEWGGSLALLAASAVGLLVILYATVSIGFYGPAFLLLIVGGAVLTLLCYPILITLERPVRITPEQAVADFFGALSHHVPHYKRMWLLLSNAGRVSEKFASFEGFRSYWKGRVAELKEGRASSTTPLKFQIVDFRSEKSAGKSEIDAKFTVRVSVRGRSREAPIEEVRVSVSLVKGPDRMWYLDKGTLP